MYNASDAAQWPRAFFFSGRSCGLRIGVSLEDILSHNARLSPISRSFSVLENIAMAVVDAGSCLRCWRYRSACEIVQRRCYCASCTVLLHITLNCPQGFPVARKRRKRSLARRSLSLIRLIDQPHIPGPRTGIDDRLFDHYLTRESTSLLLDLLGNTEQHTCGLFSTAFGPVSSRHTILLLHPIRRLQRLQHQPKQPGNSLSAHFTRTNHDRLRTRHV